MGIWLQFLEALDDLRHCRDEWRTVSSSPGFYDPCGDAEESAQADISLAEERVQEIFSKAVLDTEVL